MQITKGELGKGAKGALNSGVRELFEGQQLQLQLQRLIDWGATPERLIKLIRTNTDP